MVALLARAPGLAVILFLTLVSCVTTPERWAAPVVPMVTPTLAIRDVDVLAMTDDTLREDQTILLRGGTILSIAADTPIPDGVPVIDGRGLTALPGLWDMHIHALWTDARPALTHTLPAMLSHGIVGVRDMGSTADALMQARAALKGREAAFPELVASGPLIDGPRSAWTLPVAAAISGPQGISGAVTAAVAGGADFLKVYGNLDARGYAALAQAARSANRPFAGHVPNALTLGDVVAAGQRSVEHLEITLSRSCGHQESAKVFGDWLVAWLKDSYTGRFRQELAARQQRDVARCAELLNQAAKAGLWWTPTILLELRDRSVMDNRFRQLATPEDMAACRETADQIDAAPASLRRAVRAGVEEDLRALQIAGIRLLAGSDFSNACVLPVDGLFRELALMVGAGLSPYEALRTATVEPAAYLGRSASAGTLEPGKLADILLVKGNPLQDINAVRNTAVVIRLGTPVPERPGLLRPIQPLAGLHAH